MKDRRSFPIGACAVLCLLAVGAPAWSNAALDPAALATLRRMAETLRSDARNVKLPPRFDVKAPAGAPTLERRTE